MSDLTPWLNPSQNVSNALARKTQQEVGQIMAQHMIAAAREQAIAAETAIAVNNTIWLARMARDALKDIPEAAPLVMPLLNGYAEGARFRNQFRL